jgi:cytidyltransferase-like protein
MKEKTVAVSGGFDPIHIGHVRMIREASKLGKVVVILNNDAFLMRKKGLVFMPLEERKEILENIKGVDSVFVSIDEDDSVNKSLEAVRPDIFANGGDRKAENEIREAEICKRLGIEMVFNVGGGKVQSSSWLTKPKKQDNS